MHEVSMDKTNGETNNSCRRILEQGFFIYFFT